MVWSIFKRFLLVFFFMLIATSFTGEQYLVDPEPVEAQSPTSCPVSIHNNLTHTFEGVLDIDPCPITCPPFWVPYAGFDGPPYDINGATFTGYDCAAPSFPPDKPGVNAGSVCLGGTSRTVSLSVQGGNQHEIEISPGSVVNLGSATAHTFTNLSHNTAYQFRGQSYNGNGGSGWSAWTSAVYQDSAAPTTTPSPVGTLGSNGWYTSNVSVSLVALDDGCLGVAGTAYTLDGVGSTYSGVFNVNGDGTHSLSYASTDGTNTEATQSTSIAIDTVTPTTTASLSGTPVNGWYTNPPTLTLSATDATSGVAATAYQLDGGGFVGYSAPFAISGEGSHTVDFSSSDIAGNIEVSQQISFQLDTLAPTPASSYAGANAGGWFNVNPTITLSATDAQSGVSSIEYNLDNAGWVTYTAPFVVSGDGLHTLDYRATDNAGHVSGVSTDNFQIDTQVPSVSLTVDGSFSNGWYTDTPMLTFTATDDTSLTTDVSGIASIVYSLNGGTPQTYNSPVTVHPDGAVVIDFQTIDNAGNLSANQRQTIYVDKITPELTALNCPSPVDPGAFTATATASDSLAAIAGWEAIITTEADGYARFEGGWVNATETLNLQTLDATQHTITLTIWDYAGHSAHASCTVDVNEILLVPDGSTDLKNLPPSDQPWPPGSGDGGDLGDLAPQFDNILQSTKPVPDFPIDSVGQQLARGIPFNAPATPLPVLDYPVDSVGQQLERGIPFNAPNIPLPVMDFPTDSLVQQLLDGRVEHNPPVVTTTPPAPSLANAAGEAEVSPQPDNSTPDAATLALLAALAGGTAALLARKEEEDEALAQARQEQILVDQQNRLQNLLQQMAASQAVTVQPDISDYKRAYYEAYARWQQEQYELALAEYERQLAEYKAQLANSSSTRGLASSATRAFSSALDRARRSEARGKAGYFVTPDGKQMARYSDGDWVVQDRIDPLGLPPTTTVANNRPPQRARVTDHADERPHQDGGDNKLNWWEDDNYTIENPREMRHSMFGGGNPELAHILYEELTLIYGNRFHSEEELEDTLRHNMYLLDQVLILGPAEPVTQLTYANYQEITPLDPFDYGMNELSGNTPFTDYGRIDVEQYAFMYYLIKLGPGFRDLYLGNIPMTVESEEFIRNTIRIFFWGEEDADPWKP